MRFFAIVLGASAFTLAVAGLASNAWLDAWHQQDNTHDGTLGLFYQCYQTTKVQVPYSLTPVTAPTDDVTGYVNCVESTSKACVVKPQCVCVCGASTVRCSSFTFWIPPTPLFLDSHPPRPVPAAGRLCHVRGVPTGVCVRCRG